MARIDTSKLQLKSFRQKDEIQYDPHLQEEKCRADAERAPTRNKRYVDVLVKLKSPGATVEGLIVTGPPEGRIVTGRVAIEDIEKVRAQVDSLKAATELHLCLYNSVPVIHADRGVLDQTLKTASFEPSEGMQKLGLDGSGVIVGVVDIGCDFRHANFRDEGNKTRLLYLWDQSAKVSEESDQEPPFNYGRQFTSEQIDNALKVEGVDGKNAAYKELGYAPLPGAHGTHVLDVAAGNGRELAIFPGGQKSSISQSPPGIAPKADLIFVELKSYDDGSLGNSRYLVEAVEYIFKKAEELGKPAVVNVSLSTTGGPHDGTALVEEKFDELLRVPGRAIVVSAGNSFNQRSHLSGTVCPGKGMEILWHTDPRQTTPPPKNEMEVWYSGSQELQVTLVTPDGHEVGSVPLGETRNLADDTDRYGRISHRRDDPNNRDNQIDIRLPHLDGVEAPWRIRLSSPKGGEVPFHAWIEQDERGQSRFEGPTDPFFTLGSISCSRKALTVGAYDTTEKASLAPPLEATSAGPTRPSQRGMVKPQEKPELSAPGLGVVAARAHGGVTIMSGTSTAAAHVSGVVALLFDLAQRRGDDPLPIDVTRDLLIKAARGRSLESPLAIGADPVERERRLGAGSVDAAGAIQALLESKIQRRDSVSLQAPLPDRPNMETRMEEMSDQLKKVSGKLARMMRMVDKLANNEPFIIPPPSISEQPSHLRRNGKKH